MSSTKVEYKGRIEWRNEKGERHREDGPAIERPDCSKHWYLNGKLHREDGPAVDWSDGTKFWYLNGKVYSKDQWEKETLKLKLKRLSEL